MRVFYIVFGVTVLFMSGLFAFLGGQFGAKNARRQTQASTSEITELKEEVSALRRRISMLESELKGLRESIEDWSTMERKVSRKEEEGGEWMRNESDGASSKTSAGGGDNFTRDELREMMRQMMEEMQKKKGGRSFEEEKTRVLRRLVTARDRLFAGEDKEFQEVMEASGIGAMESEDVRRILVDWLSMAIQLVESIQEKMSDEEVERMRKDLEDKLKSMVEQVLAPEQLDALQKQFPKGVLAEIVK